MRSLAARLAANERLNATHVLKEAFGQLWGISVRLGAAVLRQLACPLKRQRLKPYEPFAVMVLDQDPHIVS